MGTTSSTAVDPLISLGRIAKVNHLVDKRKEWRDNYFGCHYLFYYADAIVTLNIFSLLEKFEII